MILVKHIEFAIAFRQNVYINNSAYSSEKQQTDDKL